MDVPVGPASLLQKHEGADERSRQMEGGWEGRGGGRKKALNEERSGLFLKTCAAESACFTANVLLF